MNHAADMQALLVALAECFGGVAEAFHKMDKDRNSLISWPEFRNACRIGGVPVSDAEVRSLPSRSSVKMKR